MAEKLTFHFEGALADKHKMNFYESARFQYAAARLIVKLAQYRQSGKFVAKISPKSNVNFNIIGHESGSFNINIEDSEGAKKKDNFIELPLSDLIAYVSERIVEKIDQDEFQKVLTEAGLSSEAIVELSGDIGEVEDYIDEYLDEDQIITSLNQGAREIIKRRVAEARREQMLQSKRAVVQKIDFESGQKLVAMAAPLLSEMAKTSLRRSAESFEIISTRKGVDRSVLFLDRRMGNEIETAIVDREPTIILGDVIQFNKDNGWGKVKIEDNTKILGFSVPYDKLDGLKQVLIDNMKKDLVYLHAYFVRDRSGEVKRMLVVAIAPPPEK